ncbi:transposase [Aliikangiella coralliicola]|uniref:Transposase n=1 Tax=Aliikangiella coralliicola TaxID=2592383 RepID=A0A545U4K8_9GAMM|nr:transposase [Aliikangiella coralliicola]TQV84396.1 transposase [Aliikangiella coralliicola]
MAIARKELVDSETPGFYHCISRCVRRAFLCGDDPFTGNNCDHRKAWLEKRMLELAEIFAVQLYAYAIMDNHYHLVLYLDPKAPLNWSKEKVAESWLRAYPGKLDNLENRHLRELKKQAIMANDKKLKKYRKRLGSLSWFMARLNEPLAKNSNIEDNVKGRFWESRYQSIALLDETAVLSCMAYVDLNPVRAGVVQELEKSLHTSIKKRIDEERRLDVPIQPVAGNINGRPIQMKLNHYLQLVEWTGKAIVHPDKASIPPYLDSVFNRLNLQQDNWLTQIHRLGLNNRAIGSIEKLKQRASALKRKWIKGSSFSKLLYVSTSQS